jgi:hypothetical protein
LNGGSHQGAGFDLVTKRSGFPVFPPGFRVEFKHERRQKGQDEQG